MHDASKKPGGVRTLQGMGRPFASPLPTHHRCLLRPSRTWQSLRLLRPTVGTLADVQVTYVFATLAEKVAADTRYSLRPVYCVQLRS